MKKFTSLMEICFDAENEADAEKQTLQFMHQLMTGAGTVHTVNRISLAPDEPTRFPRLVLLEDTGERRYPAEGEFYYWTNDAGVTQGPFRVEEDSMPSEVADWAAPAENYAIYREVK